MNIPVHAWSISYHNLVPRLFPPEEERPWLELITWPIEN
jgi:hypothetical protein